MQVRVSVKHTLSTNPVDSSQQLAHALMRVDALSHSLETVAKDELDDGAIDIGRVEHTCKRVAALVRRMAHSKVTHDVVKDGSAERIVAVPASVSTGTDIQPRRLHGLFVPRYEPLGYRDKPASTCICLAVPDHDDAPPQLYVRLTDVPIFSDATAGKDEHEYVARCWHLIDTTP